MFVDFGCVGWILLWLSMMRLVLLIYCSRVLCGCRLRCLVKLDRIS